MIHKGLQGEGAGDAYTRALWQELEIIFDTTPEVPEKSTSLVSSLARYLVLCKREFGVKKERG